MKKIVTKTKKIASKTKEVTQKVARRAISPTPKWAQWCRNMSIILASLGGTIKLYPEVFPEIALTYETHMLATGVFFMLVFQSFKKL